MTNDCRMHFSNTGLRQAALAGAIGIFALMTAVGASAQQSTTTKMTGLNLNKDQPIQIESDKLEIHDSESNAVFTGKVNVVQGTTTMKAGKMIVFYKKKPQPDANGKPAPVAETKKPAAGNSVVSGDTDIDHILVSEKVYLTSGTQTATADNGSFDMAAQLAILKGDKVILTDGPNVFTGCMLTVHMDTGEAQLDSCGGRVQIQLDPKSKQPAAAKTN
ncbi:MULTISPECIES: LptA/OstA family protein [Rhizobium]|uniref:LptA/OstA family protein n=1 Tax=Rhizobium rhododendri TaxID=2506430 RepID=A0ABY8IH67_9HYPH|nr:MULTISPECIES: LptA/OstA family protein [Rhizobium]MBO9097076.1 LPS ABC transporter substrate-binding protein LptA [Rhizobium sp. L58/93]MBO9134072.1 LPS ABC transporter substrate-binding protein LptA [Rhizobium sp. B209b/85]MBO9167314.1 LPS ABC transporter substrate-binding protein LptA [Rhizobium sp. L245/93]MBO9183273.1 LPS ABC transporter substrate-binding protein LptA [Rhizobium sp. E27B/91]MBZ5759806.1 LPS ABC transporter substrate-binding protein LptA [Rhizobium sp. VS19-DR96]